MTRDQEIAWAAGLFEGEGSWSLKERRRCLRLQLSTTDKDVLESFRNIVGAGRIIDRHERRPNRKRLWGWYVERGEAERVADLLRPFMHQRRRNRLDEIRGQLAVYRATSRRHRLGVSAEQTTFDGMAT